MLKKIGHEVLFLNAKKGNARNGEGDFYRLDDGRIMFAFTEYIGDDGDDHAHAQISAVFSDDEGDSWYGRRTLFPMDEGSMNNMCVSFLKMENGEIGLFYGQKYRDAENNICMRVRLRRSSDNAVTWTEPINCTSDGYYFVFENARVIRHSSGRIIIPVNCHNINDSAKAGEGVTWYFYSDDDGSTFYDSGHRIRNPFDDGAAYGLQETGVIEMENGRLFSFSRTGFATQFESFSDDVGKTWSTPAPSLLFTSPASPMHVRHLSNGKTVAVWNPIPKFPGRRSEKGIEEWSRRTPLIAFACQGKGEEFWTDRSKWNMAYLLEDDDKNAYCYSAVFGGEDYFLCAYYHSNNTKSCLNSCKITKVYYSEME